MPHEKPPTREELAKRFAKDSEHPEAEIRRMLAAYADPSNPNTEMGTLFRAITNAIVGDGSSIYTKDDIHVSGEMMRILGEVTRARRFNAKYIGHLLTRASTPAFLGALLALLTGSNTVSREVSKAESALEPEAINFLKDIVGYGPESSGTFTVGGSTGILAALTVTRKLLQVRAEEEGRTLDQAKPVLVFANRLAHYSTKKMCDLLGGPHGQIKVVQIGTRGLRMSTVELKRKLEAAQRNGEPVMAIVGIAGETETGRVDPLDKIADLADEYTVSFIVDGAYGAPYNISSAKDKFKGLERAFAIVVDSHKALNTPYGAGAVLFRNASDHAWLNIDVEAPYLGGAADPDRTKSLTEQRKQKHKDMVRRLLAHEEGPGEKRIEGSVGAGAILSTLAVARTLGKEGLRTMLDLTLDRIKYLHSLIDAEETKYLEIAHKYDLPMLCFTLTREARKQLNLHSDQAIHEFITRTRTELDKGIDGEGGYFLSETELTQDNGKKIWVYRACIMHSGTTNEILKEAVTGLGAIIEREIQKVKENRETGEGSTGI